MLRATTRATVKGLPKESGKTSILFSIKVTGNVFGIYESMGRSLQCPGLTASYGDKLENSLSKMTSEKVVFFNYFGDIYPLLTS